MARPSKYTDAFARVGESMCRLGATDQEVADALGIDRATLYRWKGQHEAFCDALKVGKESADARVERSLFARATGYEHEEVDIRVVGGEIVMTPIRKHYPPDTVACIFWLKNRKPEEWREKREEEQPGADDAALAAQEAIAAAMGTVGSPG